MVSVIIAGAGNSARMEGVNKQFAPIGGVPLIIKSALCFKDIPKVSEIIIAARREDTEQLAGMLREYRVKAILTEGGKTRQESVINAFKKANPKTHFIAVHEWASPFVPADAVIECIEDASVFGAAALGVPVKDTIKAADGGFVTDTLDRTLLYIIQTPQIFRRDIYVRGINYALEHGLDFTDDCQLAEAVGAPVRVTPSVYSNLKITTIDDLLTARAMAMSM